MINDELGLTKIEFEKFSESFDQYLIVAGEIWSHKSRFNRHSVSVVTDKHLSELFRKYINQLRPKTGSFCGKSIYELLKDHQNNEFLLYLDISNYFGSITPDHIASVFEESHDLKGYKSIVTNIYFGDKGLRKGLIASPVISEVVGNKMDKLIKTAMNTSGKSPYTYSRYYDDIIITGNDIQLLKSLRSSILINLSKVLNLEVNRKKNKIVRLQGQSVLGLVFDKGNLVVPKYFKNRLRAIIHKYDFYPEEFLSEVYDKMQATGTIIGSLYRIVNSSSRDTTKYEELLGVYSYKLSRLKELAEEYKDDEYRNDVSY